MYYWPFPFPEESGSSSRPADESSRPLSPDEQISATVLARLLLDDRTRPGQVTIQTQAGVVILSGTMPTAEARTVAAQIAATTTGARDVCNILRVPRHRFLLRDRSLAALLVMSAYISLVVGILGGVVGWIALALICALAASAVESRYVRGTQRGRGSR
ncbi:BON domain-containing protein [Cryptosporangium minutisporangium]